MHYERQSKVVIRLESNLSFRKMASTSSCGHDTCRNVTVVEDHLGSPLNERFHEIVHVVPAAIVRRPRSLLSSLVTLLPSYMYGILGNLVNCLRFIPVEHPEIAIASGNVINGVDDVQNGDTTFIANSNYVSLESKHTVFLSHSGAQKDFVEQLCVDLERSDRYPFFDKLRSSLPIGVKFPKLIFKAIKQCQVGVVVLSEEFLMSKWPMMELNAMVEEHEKDKNKITIIPVFYSISVEDWKAPKNRDRWKSQWKEWVAKDERMIVKDWEKVIRYVESINGLKKEDKSDVKIREEIVGEVGKLIPCETKWDDSHVQGRLRSCKVVQDKMDGVFENSRVCVVGLYGMGGIGKTTICKALCNDLSSKFHDKVCHVELGSGNQKRVLISALKKLTHIRHDVLENVDDVEQAFTYLKKHVVAQPIFLAIDNVQDNHKSIEAARAYLKACYALGSVVLVTSRSLDTLKKLNLDENSCLEMPELEEDEAKSLFLYYAELPPGKEVEEALIKSCIKRCHFLKGGGRSRHYHPLALKVLGQQFGCNPMQFRRIDTFNKHKDKHEEHPVFSILRSSYDSLEEKLQFIFLDIALLCDDDDDFWLGVFSTMDWLSIVYEDTIEEVKTMLEVLKTKSLIEDLSGDFSSTSMHDLWREFARAETKAQDLKESRWVYHVDGKSVLGRSGRWRENVERMCFLNEGWRGLNGQKLEDFVNVTVFEMCVEISMGHCDLDLDLSGFKHLKSLMVSTYGLKVRVEGLRSLLNLGFIAFSGLGITPCLEDIRLLTNLQVLVLIDCAGVEVLDLTMLTLLRIVILCNIPDLITVKGLNSKMIDLRLFGVVQCKSFRECPGLGELFVLQTLHLTNCDMLEEVPYLGRLTNLRAIFIWKCKSIRAVPGLSDLVALKRFDADGCLKLAILPDLVKLTKLEELSIRECPIQGVLGLDGLIALSTLCASFGQVVGGETMFPKLSLLKVVDIRDWNGPIWTGIQNLLMLEDLILTSCNEVDVMPDMQKWKGLKVVQFFDCNFKDLSSLSNSRALESLSLNNCNKLERLPEFEKLTKLRHLAILWCYAVRDWPSTSSLLSIRALVADGWSLRKLAHDLESLIGLQELHLYKRHKSMLSMASLPRLQILKISHCARTDALELSSFPQLKEIQLCGCIALTRMTCSIQLVDLIKLKVEGCEILVELPDLSRFPQLEKLILRRCMALKRLSCSSPTSALEVIKVIGCDPGVEIPDLTKFPKLRKYSVEDSFF